MEIREPTDAERREWELEFEAAACRPLEQRMKYAFIKTYKPVLDDAPSRSFDGIERFEDAWKRHVEVEGLPACHPHDIIASKRAAGRAKDLESLPRLMEFRHYWEQHLRR